jgi:hypothetical protein
MKRDESHAIESFKGLIDRSIGRASKLLPFPAPVRTFNFNHCRYRRDRAAITSAEHCPTGYEYICLALKRIPAGSIRHPNIHSFTVQGLLHHRTLGDFHINVKTRTAVRTFTVAV